jgi:hypothetical protein
MTEWFRRCDAMAVLECERSNIHVRPTEIAILI